MSEYEIVIDRSDGTESLATVGNSAHPHVLRFVDRNDADNIAGRLSLIYDMDFRVIPASQSETE